MQPFYADYLDRLEKLHTEIDESLKGLPQVTLDWVPGEGMNSICVLVVHIAGSERFWIGDVAMGESSDRDRDAEFKANNLDVGILKSKLAASLQYAAQSLEKLTLGDLANPCISPRDGKGYRVAWALAHALEHTAIHTGHLQLTRQLWLMQDEG